MSQTRRVIKKTRPAQPTFDEQFWPVILALLVLGGFLVGTLSAYLRVDDPRWYANAWTWTLALPVLIGAMAVLLRLVDHQYVRRGVQLSIVLGLAVHLLLFVWMKETDIFGRFRQTVALIPELEEHELLVEPDYQEFQLDPEQRRAQVFERPVETAVPDTTLQTQRTTRQVTSEAMPATHTIELEAQPPQKTNVPQRRELREAVPRFAEHPAPLRRAVAEHDALPVPRVSAAQAEEVRQPALQALAGDVPREASAAAAVPADAPVSTPDPRPVARSVARRPKQHSAPQNQVSSSRVERGTRAPETPAEVPAARPADPPTRPPLAPPTLAASRVSGATAAELDSATPPDEQADRPGPVDHQRRVPSAAPAMPNVPALRPPADVAVRPLSTTEAETLEARPPAEDREPNVEPSSFAVARSLSGTAGVGQAPNIDRSIETSSGPSSLPSQLARRKRATQDAPAGPSLVPTEAARLRRAVGTQPQPQVVRTATTPDTAALAASAVDHLDTAEAPATVERAAANAARAPETAALGISELDLGPPRVVGRQASGRPAGGGQPEIQLSNELQRLARSRAAGSSRARADDRAATGPAVSRVPQADPQPDNAEPLGGVTAAATSPPRAASSSTASPTVWRVPSPEIAMQQSSAVTNRGSGLAQPNRRGTEMPSQTTTNRSEERSPSHRSPSAPSSGSVVRLPDQPQAPASRSLPAGGQAPARDLARAAAPSTAGPRLDVDLEVALGPGGLLPDGSTEPGVRSRRASRESDVLQLPAARFPRRSVGGPPRASTQAIRGLPPFAGRENRLMDPAAGAGPETDEAIERGLAFLARHQLDDGSWSLQSFGEDVALASDTAATGLSLLAFLGAGYHHREHRYAEVVDRGLHFLLERQKDDGDLYVPLDEQSSLSAWLYSHGIAALALSEAYGMTQDPELAHSAQKAIDFVVASQDRERGGWRYTPGYSSDTSVTGWMWMALHSAQLANLQVPGETMDRARRWLETAQASDPHLYRYNPYAPDTPSQRHGRLPSPTMTAVGLLLRLYDGWDRNNPEMQRGVEYLLTHSPAVGTVRDPQRDTYYWYYATQVLFHAGGEQWQQWNRRLRPLLTDTQILDGPNAGSWDPRSPVADRWSYHAGRLYVTALNLLSLEVHYRHLPLYIETGGRQ